MDRRMLVASLSALVLLAAPGLAHAATNVGVEHVQGLDLVDAADADSAATIETTLGVDQTDGPFVAVQNAAGATPGAECQPASATVVGLSGHVRRAHRVRQRGQRHDHDAPDRR
jgi:hypothetical protein